MPSNDATFEVGLPFTADNTLSAQTVFNTYSMYLRSQSSNLTLAFLGTGRVAINRVSNYGFSAIRVYYPSVFISGRPIIFLRAHTQTSAFEEDRGWVGPAYRGMMVTTRYGQATNDDIEYSYAYEKYGRDGRYIRWVHEAYHHNYFVRDMNDRGFEIHGPKTSAQSGIYISFIVFSAW